MGNQMEKALNEAAENTPGNVIEALNKISDQMDKLPANVDIIYQEVDNGTDAAKDAKEQEEPNASITELQSVINDQKEQIDDQKEQIDKLIEIMGKMVTRYGASISDTQENDNDPLNPEVDDDINLSSLRLGSM